MTNKKRFIIDVVVESKSDFMFDVFQKHLVIMSREVMKERKNTKVFVFRVGDCTQLVNSSYVLDKINKRGGRMTHDEGRILLEAIQDAQFSGTKWESDFLLSIEGWIEDGKKITAGQSSTLQTIYRKAVGG